jgi:iron complex outermembrane receptor protein
LLYHLPCLPGLIQLIFGKDPMKYTQILASLLIAVPGLQAHAEQPQIEKIQTEETVQLETVKVSADFRQLDLQQLPSAITVVGADAIKNRNADHLERVLSLAPNVNFAASASRARYFQIRGIGERSQFTDPINPSVGLIIDGNDMTGLGGAATLFDVEQIEILRGPQGTAFGASALAGAINIKSNQPTKETQGYVEAKAGNYNTQGLGGAVSGSLTENIQARFAINKVKTDGYMKNLFLDSKDTNNIDETVARGQLAWQINENNDLNILLFKTDINNGYDAFSLDNNRNTYSNMPGKDEQDTTAISALWNSKVNDAFGLQVNGSTSKTESEYSYDEDWTYGNYDINTGECLDDCIRNADGTPTFGYTSFDEYLRDYERDSIDVRLISGQEGRIFKDSTNWIVGIFSSSKEVELTRNYTYDPQYKSDIKTNATAVYTELSSQLSLNNRLIYGLRIEDTSFDFSDNNGLSKNQSETLWGGKITFESMTSIDHLAYVSLARGFKAGSVNRNPIIADDKRLYDTEINHSLETGVKSSLLNDKLQTRIAIFFTQREDQQVKQSFLYYKDSDPLELSPKFTDYFGNAGKGHNYGIELESSFKVSSSTEWDLSLGLLKTEFIDYDFKSKDENNNVITISKDGREQAHAPSYSVATAIIQQLTNAISLRIETELKDSFYYSDSHDEKSKAYQLWNASLNYTMNNLEISLHARNLLDEDYITKGFGFDNDPRVESNNTQHIQLGDPRLVSLTARYNF